MASLIKKIKVMQQDGTFSDYIPLAVETIDNLTSTEIKKPLSARQGKILKDFINKNISDIEKTNDDLENASNTLSANIISEINARQNADNTLQSQIHSLASGSPLAANQLSDMTDTSKIYVLTTDGYWYYYDGADWVSGGVYQGTVLSTEDEKRLSNLETQTEIVNCDFINYGYVNTSGNYVSNNLTRCTNFIPVKNYNKIHCYIMNYSQSCAVAYYDNNKIFLSEESIIGQGSRVYTTYDIPSTASYVRICNYNDSHPIGYAYIYNDESNIYNFDYLMNNLDYYNYLKGEILTINADFSVDGFYVSNNGGIRDNNDSKCTPYINVKGFTNISFKLSMASTNRMVAYYDFNKKILSTESISGTGSPVTSTVTIPENAYFVRFSNYYTNNSQPYARIYKQDSLLQKIESGNSILTGKKIGYLGDSITNGYLANLPFRTIITNTTGSTQYNYGINSSTLSNYNGGSNPVVERYQNMDDDLDYICVLIGTNDTAPMGDEDSSDTTTFYGALNTLIEGLITKYTTKKIMFMTLLPRRNANLSSKNTAIKNRCEYYSIPCFDLFHYSNMNPNVDIVNETLFGNQDGLHPNDAGHQMLANKIQKWLESL